VSLLFFFTPIVTAAGTFQVVAPVPSVVFSGGVSVSGTFALTAPVPTTQWYGGGIAISGTFSVTAPVPTVQFTGSGVPVHPPIVAEIEDVIRLVRIFPHVHQDRLRLFISRLELEAQRGVGLSSGQGQDPQVLVSASHDGGMTFGPERSVSIGRLGVYTQRLYVNRLGRARDWVFKIVVTDPVFVAFASCLIDLEVGTH